MKKRPAAASRPSAPSAKSVKHSAAAAVKEEPVDTDVHQPSASSSKPAGVASAADTSGAREPMANIDALRRDAEEAVSDDFRGDFADVVRMGRYPIRLSGPAAKCASKMRKDENDLNRRISNKFDRLPGPVVAYLDAFKKLADVNRASSAKIVKSERQGGAAAVKEEPVDMDAGLPLASSMKQVKHITVTTVKAELLDFSALPAAAEQAATKKTHKDIVEKVVRMGRYPLLLNPSKWDPATKDRQDEHRLPKSLRKVRPNLPTGVVVFLQALQNRDEAAVRQAQQAPASSSGRSMAKAKAKKRPQEEVSVDDLFDIAMSNAKAGLAKDLLPEILRLGWLLVSLTS